MFALNSQQIESYNSNGYLVIKNLIDRDTIDKLKNKVKAIFSTAQQKTYSSKYITDNDFNNLLFDLFQDDFSSYHGAAKLANHCIELHKLSLDNKLLSIIDNLGLQQASICARPLMWFHSPSLAKTPRYQRLPAHQEWSNMQGSLNAITAWLPLVDISAEMGRLQIIPQSHLQGLLPFSNSPTDDYPFKIDEKYYQEHDFLDLDIDVGDCLFFSAFLIHRSGINQSNKIRWTINFRYNDMAEQNFIKRNYLNPYQFDVSPQLIDDFMPSEDLIKNIYQP